MQKTIKNKVYTFKENLWWGIDKNGKEFKVTVKGLLEQLNATDNPNQTQSELKGIINLADSSVTPNPAQEKETVVEDVDIKNVKEIKGLGDLIATVTSAVGIEPCEECNKRKEYLNKKFPWMKKEIRELTQEEIEMLEKATAEPNKVKGEYIKAIFKLYNEVFMQRVEVCRCPGLLSRIISRLKDLYNYGKAE